MGRGDFRAGDMRQTDGGLRGGERAKEEMR